MITVLTGNNSFLLQQELKRLVNDFVGSYGELNLERLDGEEATAERLIEATHSLPFLAEKKLVILRNPGSQKAFVEKIEEIINGIPDGVEVIVVEPKIDRRSSYFKVLKSKTVFMDFTQPDSQKLNTWIVQFVKDLGGSIGMND